MRWATKLVVLIAILAVPAAAGVASCALAEEPDELNPPVVRISPPVDVPASSNLNDDPPAAEPAPAPTSARTPQVLPPPQLVPPAPPVRDDDHDEQRPGPSGGERADDDADTGRGDRADDDDADTGRGDDRADDDDNESEDDGDVDDDEPEGDESDD